MTTAETRQTDVAPRAPLGAREAVSPRRSFIYTTVGVLATVALLLVSLFVGVYDLSDNELSPDMFWITRVPRTVALVLAGVAMSMCGLIMQLLVQNRFVEPTTTGTTEWAGLGLMLVWVMVPGASISLRMAGAVVMSFIGTMIFFAFLRRVSLRTSLIVPLVGIMLGAVVGAFSTYIALSMDMLQQLTIWFAGNFTSVVRGRYELLWVVFLVTVLVFFVADRFTAASLGKDVATNIGLNYHAIVLLGVGMVSIATGVVTVVIGSLPFLGLIVPNIVSLIRGDNLRSNLLWVCMGGIWAVTVCDILARTIIMPFEMPVSVILGVFGAVVFVFLIVARRGRG